MNEIEATNEDNFLATNQSVHVPTCTRCCVRSLVCARWTRLLYMYREKLQCRRAGFTTGNYRRFEGSRRNLTPPRTYSLCSFISLVVLHHAIYCLLVALLYVTESSECRDTPEDLY